MSGPERTGRPGGGRRAAPPGGFTVHPAKVEEVLAGHPDIADVAVVGLLGAERGGEIRAVAVPRHENAAPAAIITWSRERPARHTQPRRAEVVGSLPRTRA
ncbi:AMP-binding enzyme [Streptomyces sp. URMC 129]|uniref:AMP-binding enzyme n=1 Tax=Streptomyces sp. URMC 129 TaxID=3423407 RepID=UPI003F1CF58C